MDGENNGKPYFLMDDLGVKPTIFGNIHIHILDVDFCTANHYLSPNMKKISGRDGRAMRRRDYPQQKETGAVVTCLEDHPSHLEGEQPYLGDLLTMVINHLLNGMILQVVGLIMVEFPMNYCRGGLGVFVEFGLASI